MERTDRKKSEFGDSTTVLIRDGDSVEDMTKTIEAKLLGDSPLPASCCIFRVPQSIRRQERDAYEPHIISIGPFHRAGPEKFQLMDKIKRWYLKCLLKRTDTKVESLIKGIVEFDKRARECYAETLDHLNRSDFIEMLILDGCFLIELFRKVLVADLQDENDPIFNVDCTLEYLWHDLLLLENQLPWFVLERLYDLTEKSTGPSNNASLVRLVLNFFRQSVADDINFNTLNFNSNLNISLEIVHILDLIRTLIVVPFKDLKSQKKEEQEDADYQKRKTDKQLRLPQRIPNVTTLLKAGVEFRKSPESETPDCIMNIAFKSGVFTIPPLGIDEKTGPLFRNLIAFEQCYNPRLHKITSYAVLMDCLIDSSKDIDLLCEKGILVNWLSSEDACKFFNELYYDTTVIGYYHTVLCKDVNEYYNDRWNK